MAVLSSSLQYRVEILSKVHVRRDHDNYINFSRTAPSFEGLSILIRGFGDSFGLSNYIKHRVIQYYLGYQINNNNNDHNPNQY